MSLSLGRSALCRLYVLVALTGGWELKRLQAKCFSWRVATALTGAEEG